ncbi:SRPBCC family protein [Egicoccus halophilus]|uniref:Carbon monoxide dehydrogenase subunit G n=1 Tax=Egicoccus halophilus TaxID=1670830 RepID=A0A8J3ESN8_9ACTN|nr:SRPBCC family protein [Egicoccus halophilus]GGI03411.1 hypothetical protein GCM10011354_03900 [Egicoccus halophilus]
MEFTNEFTVPTDVDTAFATLTDLERVAPCLPGAQLEEVDGDVHTGRVKVKVGPISMTYRGQARLVEADADARHARIEASGKETRGTGTARADVTADLRQQGDHTLVTVVTDLAVTGKPAQFGRGVMAEVGTKIIDAFAERLRELLGEDEAPDTAEPATSPAAPPDAAAAGPAADDAPTVPGRGEAALTGAAAVGAAAPATPVVGGPRRIAPDPFRADDALDLVDVAGSATLKRLLPVLAAALVAILTVVLWRRRAG